MKLLIIEDDVLVSETIRSKLKERYTVDTVTTAERAEYMAQINEYDLIIADYFLPDGNGNVVCKTIREAGITTPILMLTGKSDVETKVQCLDAGIDDYLTKPFHFTELQARIRALLRRSSANRSVSSLQVGAVTMDNLTNTVKHGPIVVTLRRKEFCLLEFLMRHAGQVVTRSMILEHVWETDTDPLTNTIDVHIRLLRNKIDKPFGTNMIKTIHGIGYKISAS